MNTWWLAIDRSDSSYDELKTRQVVAQGWPQLGDLTTMFKFIPNHRDRFARVIQMLGDSDPGAGNQPWWQRDRRPNRTPRIMWNLLNVQAGDLIVGIEGTEVKGICEIQYRASESYRYDDPDTYEYVQTIGYPVNWVDWDSDTFGFIPIPPAKGVLGIVRIRNQSQAVIDVWRMFRQ